MSKTAIYAANTASQTVAQGGTINFGNIVRRFGCLDISGGNVITNCDGYYSVKTNITVNGTAAGNAVVQLYSNGVAIPGASVSFATTTTSVTTISIPAIVRQKCCVSQTITAQISGVGANVSNAAIVVVKE